MRSMVRPAATFLAGPMLSPSNAPWEVARAPDLSPSPSVVEVNLEARLAQVALLDGRLTTLWTYNGVVGAQPVGHLG